MSTNPIVINVFAYCYSHDWLRIARQLSVEFPNVNIDIQDCPQKEITCRDEDQALQLSQRLKELMLTARPV
jgi:hypothetical protein